MWLARTWDQLFMRRSYTQKNKFFLKTGVIGKTPVFVIALFCTRYSIFVNIGFWQGSFVWKCCKILILVFLTQKWYSVFIRKVFDFLKITSLLKKCQRSSSAMTFEFCCDSLVKICGSLKRRVILKIFNYVFQEKNVFLVDIKMKNFFPVLRILEGKP